MSIAQFSLRAAATGLFAVVTAFTAQDVSAQGSSGTSVGWDLVGPTIEPETYDPGFRPIVSQAPKHLVGRQPPSHPRMPIPQGPPAPQNTDAPGRDLGENQQPYEAGQFRFYSNRQLGVTGTSSTGEPSAAQIRDVVLQTGNWYAALSTNSGRNFTEISPATFFPSIDGGFCCDQRVLYVRSHDLLVWLLQYGYSSTTQRGSYRIAVARGRDAARSNDASMWRSYTYSPANFGFGTGNWLDFPDMAASNDWLHISSNVYDANRNYQGSVRWRMELDDLAAGAGASTTYSTNTGLGGGFSYRFAQGGDGSSIYYAAFKNTTTLFLWRTTDAGGNNTRWERTVNNWTNATASCPGPDALDWCGRVVGRLRGAFGDANRIGFMWTSAGNGGSRPLPYTRIVTFNVSDMSKASDNDQWSSTLTWAYGTGASNSQGHIGMVFAVGGPNSYVHSSATIVDNYQTGFGAMTTVSMGGGTDGPSANRWGDYFDVQRHPTNSSTFVGTGMQQNGSSARTSNNPRFTWFGRDDYEPTLVGLTVDSTGAANVPVTIDVLDWNGNRNGTTSLSRSYAPRQGLELTVPQTVSSGGVLYVFERWAHKTTPTVGFALKALGERTLTIADIGNIDDIAEARYLRVRTLSVDSSNPSTGVSVTVSAADINGSQNGTTGFTRSYPNGESVTLTAPSAVGFNSFRYWILNGVVQSAGNRVLTLTMNRTHTARAVYFNNIAGAVREIGAGCSGSNGVPVHTITWPAGQQGPQQGTRTTYGLRNARANGFAAFYVGVQTQSLGAFPLPLLLDFIGMEKCVLYHDLAINVPVLVDPNGRASLDIRFPRSSRAIGSSIYTTFAIIDPGANTLGIVHSNAMETVQGGNR